MNLEDLKIKIFSDGAYEDEMYNMYSNKVIKGLTTNPTLMRKAGVENYTVFCKKILETVKTKPISFEVFSDDFEEMERQARIISSWGSNVYVKIPITNTKNKSTKEIIKKLSDEGIKLNITAITTLSQVETVLNALSPKTPSYISIFAGRIADTGIDPSKIISESVKLMKTHPNSELIWASPREFLNILQANSCGCHIITVTKEILNKAFLLGYDLEEYSLDTVKMFYQDALNAGYKI